MTPDSPADTMAGVEVVYSLGFAFLGLAVGSFLNLCIDRLPADRSIVSPASHCESCQRPILPRDLIPIVSYLRLRGRCRYCQAAIPRRVLWVELVTAGLFAFLYGRYGLSPVFGTTVLLACVFLIIFVVDLERGFILNKVVYPAMALALVVAAVVPPPWLSMFPLPPIANSAIAGGTGLVFFLIVALISRGGMGWGDVKLAALIGLVMGLPLVLVALIMGAVLGGVVAIGLLATKKKGRKEGIPFGPFLAASTLITMLWGQSIVYWYLGLL